MILEDLEQLLIKHDAYKEVYGKDDNFAASLVIIRKNPPSGYSIRVKPFGNCKILNCQEKDGMIQTFFASLESNLFGY